MQIYFCGSILGGRGDQAVYRHIVTRLQSEGHVVATHHVAQPDVLEQEHTLSPRAVFERDIAWLRQADMMIAEVSTPSLGVGYEIACGLRRDIPVLCLCRQGLQISKMITGNTAPNLQVRIYGNMAELDEHLQHFLPGTD
jgi:hypothetical protein